MEEREGPTRDVPFAFPSRPPGGGLLGAAPARPIDSIFFLVPTFV